MIYLSSPHMSSREREYLLDAFDSNWIAPLGPYVDRFETDLARYVDMPYSVALSSGTAALHLGLLVLGVQPGDLVLTSSLTFVATANAIKYMGATPIFIDSEPDSWNMDPGLLAEELRRIYARGERVAAVLPVDLYGRCADYKSILKVCEKYGVPVLEDAAEALGSEYQGRKAGNFGKLAAFSFNGNKIMTTGGGGALVSHDKGLIDRARYLSTQAKLPMPYYQHEEVGFNYRMSNLLAAVGCGQLEVLDEHIDRRKKINQEYVKALPGARVALGNSWLTTMICDKPEEFRRYLFEHQIESRPIWKPMHLQPLYKDCRMVGGSVSEKIFETGLCLPSGSALSLDQQGYVIERIHEFYRKNT
jgi:dTDP-4-amino-4,6-dideoxygalactose transaminase